MYVHRCRFVEYTPATINALAFTPLSTQPLLACGRANGEIEIWNPTQRWNLEKIIPGAKNTSVEALTWVHQTVSKETDNHHSQTMEKQEENDAKVMALAWDHDDKFIVSGSSDSNIIKWDVHNARVIQRMTVDTIKGKDNIVWAINILNGDSLGNICFWDSKHGTMLQKFKAHDADALCLVSNKEGTMVFSSGVDRKCNLFRMTDHFTAQSSDDADSNENNWILVGFRRTHLHDVKAIALREDLNDKFFVSGDKLQRLPFIPQKPLISISKSKKLLMYRSINQIKMWRLGSGEDIMQLKDSWQLEQIPNLDLIEPQKAILEMTLKGNNHLMASALSEDGEWIAVSDVETIKVFKIQND
ncbi:579_t:CDS:2, partial [Cetraspora pellucida]